MASRPVKNSSRLRHWQSSEYALATTSGLRVFHAFSAACTFARADSSVKGGKIGVVTVSGVPAKDLFIVISHIPCVLLCCQFIANLASTSFLFVRPMLEDVDLDLSDASKHLSEVFGERLVRAGGIARQLLHVRRREVAIACAESLEVLAHCVSEPL